MLRHWTTLTRSDAHRLQLAADGAGNGNNRSPPAFLQLFLDIVVLNWHSQVQICCLPLSPGGSSSGAARSRLAKLCCGRAWRQCVRSSYIAAAGRGSRADSGAPLAERAPTSAAQAAPLSLIIGSVA